MILRTKSFPWDCLGIFLVSLGIIGVFARIGVDPHHDGLLFKPALDVANGKILYKETYTLYGFLSTFIQSASLLILGKSVLAIRIATAFFMP